MHITSMPMLYYKLITMKRVLNTHLIIQLTVTSSTNQMFIILSLVATLFSATGGNFSAIHVDYVDFVPELGGRFRSRNL